MTSAKIRLLWSLCSTKRSLWKDRCDSSSVADLFYNTYFCNQSLFCLNFGPRLYAVLSDEWWTIMEASVSVTDVKSYRSYSIKRRGVNKNFQRLWCGVYFTIRFLNSSLVFFSLLRLWCRALIGGSRTSPCVARKTNSGMIVPSAQWADVVSCRSISLVSSLTRLSLFLSLILINWWQKRLKNKSRQWLYSTNFVTSI